MTLRRMMILIGAIAFATWLAVPAVRLWWDSALRMHRQQVQDSDPLKRLSLNNEPQPGTRPTRMTAKVFTFDHRTPFGERYLALLMGRCEPFDDRCARWNPVIAHIVPEGTEALGPIDRELIADNVSIEP